MFCGACASRWLAEYGLGLGVVFSWWAVIGAGIGLAIGIVAGTVNHLNTRWSGISDSIGRFAHTVSNAAVAGIFGGLLLGAVAFAALPIAPEQIRIRGTWVEVRFENQPFVGGEGLAWFTLLPAAIGGLANSISSAFVHWRHRPFRYLVAVIGTNTAALGGFAAAALVVLVVVEARRVPNHGPGYESMMGLLPVALVLWFAIGALIGAVTGLLFGVEWIWAKYARRGGIARLTFWCVAVLGVLIVSEGAIRDWFRVVWKSP